MNSPNFQGAIAQPLATFVQYKQALSRKYRTEASALRLFDRYLSEHHVSGWEGIDPILVDDFLKSRPRARPRSYNHLVGVLHRFCAWAHLQGFTDCNPLKLGDVNFAQDILFIRETKFSKSRIVPLGPRLAGRLRRYVEQCHAEKPESEVPLFSFTRRGCIGPGTISQTFHKLLPKPNLPIPPGTSPPRLHELRRSFAVRTLLRWYREGIDPNARLMHLATFLGHVDPNSTAVYLPTTEELLCEADRRFRAAAPKGGAQ